jgi:two-component sensor histidine kinase
LHRGTGDMCHLTVRDNGAGIPADFNPETLRSLGIRLIGSLTRQIDGQYEIVRRDPGTEARVSFEVKRDGSTD